MEKVLTQVWIPGLGMQSLAAVGHGGLKEGQVINKLLEEYQKKQRRKMSGLSSLLTQMS